MTGARVPDLLVEKVHLGEASEAERALVLGDPDARARLEALPAQDAAFFEALPVGEEVRRIEGRARATAARAQTGSNRAVLTAMLGPVLAMGLATVWIVAAPPSEQVPVADERPKGFDPKLRVYRNGATGPERLGSGAMARRGDVIQLGVVAGGATHGMVLSIDGRGEVTVHLPPGGEGTTRLGSGEARLPSGYELDDAPNFERFFLVSAAEGSVDVAGVVRAAERLAASGKARTDRLPLPKVYHQTTFLLSKEER